MRIDGNDPLVNSQLKLQTNDQQQAEREQSKAVEPINQVRDRLEFSAESRDFQRYEKKVQEAPEVRAERIAEIMRKVQTGTYNIKAEKVAEALITGSIVDERA
jgi:negative regulator of flagellin synthesis FlgM